MNETNVDEAPLSVGSFLQTAIAGGESIKLKINRRRNELILVDSATGHSAKLDIEMEIEDDPAEMTDGDSLPSCPPSVEKLFQELASEWRNETSHLSLAIKQVMHPAYQRIIGLGPVAIPLILRELQREPDHWFWALEAITGEKPAVPGSSVAQAAQAWLQWGKERRYI
ncbi:MAG: hypothetical protein ACREBD_13370 [Blastocatellia bacterium]